MKKNLLLTAVLIAFVINVIGAQTTIDFETLIVPDAGFYNGSADHSGTISSTETFSYEIDDTNFYVIYTLEDGYDYWNGFAYSNQIDLETADWNNYSAYATPAGGADNSSNYVFVYTSSYAPDSIMFDNPVDIENVDIANTVWAYKFMTGEDGSGHTFEAGDFFILSIIGINPDGTHNESPVVFDLAAGTEIVDNWTNVDLSGLGEVKGLIFSLTTSDSWTPNYICLDNLKYSNIVAVDNTASQNVSIYPNPAKGIVNIENVLITNVSVKNITGKTVYVKNNCFENEQINVSNLVSGIYLIRIDNGNQIFTKKLIVE